jgi:hypothetical protein
MMGMGSGGSEGSGDTDGMDTGRMEEYIEFHNSSFSVRTASLVFDLQSLPPELRLRIRLSQLDTLRALPDSISGAHPVSLVDEPQLEPGDSGKVPFGIVDKIGSIIADLTRGGAKRSMHSYKPITSFGATEYEAEPSALVTISDVQIPAFGFVAARFSVENAGKLEPGSEYRFQVQQVVKDQVVGGSVYVVRIAGERTVPVWDGKLEEVQMEQKLEHLPPWIEEVVKARMQEGR